MDQYEHRKCVCAIIRNAQRQKREARDIGYRFLHAYVHVCVCGVPVFKLKTIASMICRIHSIFCMHDIIFENPNHRRNIV